MDRPGKIGCVSSARRTYIDGRTIVGVPSGFISAGDGGHTDARLVSGRISGLSAVFITCREYHDATRHRAGLRLSVGRHARILNKVVDRLLDRPILVDPLVQRHGAGRVSPTVLTNYSAVVCRIFDGVGRRVRAGIVTSVRRVEDLAGHDLHTVAASGSACHAGDSDIVVVYCSNRTGYVRSVSLAPGDVFVVSAAKILTDPAPHIGRQVGVGVFHALIQYGDDYIAAARRLLPCRNHVYVCTGDGFLRNRSVVVKRPLLCEERIVERVVRRNGLRQGHQFSPWSRALSAHITDFGDFARNFDMIHAGNLPEVFGDLLGGTFETNDIPQVESCLTCSLGAAVVGEQPLHTGHLVPIAKFIERDVARQYPAAAGAGHVQRFGRFPVELHADHSFGPIGILRRSTFCVGIFLATGEQRQTKNEK